MVLCALSRKGWRRCTFQRIYDIKKLMHFEERPMSEHCMGTTLDMVNNKKEKLKQLLHNDMNMKRVCAKIVPRNLSQEFKKCTE